MSRYDFLVETYRSVDEETVKLITEARDVLQKDLARKAKEYQEFRQNAPLLTRGKDGATIHQETLSSLQSARSALRLRKAKLQGHLAAVEAAMRKGQSPDAMLAILVDLAAQPGPEDGRNTLAALQRDLLPLLAQEKELLRKYGPDHPEVQSVRDKIDLTRELLTRPGRAWTQAPRQITDTRRIGQAITAIVLAQPCHRHRSDHAFVPSHRRSSLFPQSEKGNGGPG